MLKTPLKMMIVDDERIILESLETLIDWKSIGIKVVATADNGATAIDLAASFLPDIILSDISMPTMSGLEMLEVLREKEMRVEVIFITAYSKFEYAKQAIKYGAADYLLKPIDETQLLETVSRCADKIRETTSKQIDDADADISHQPPRTGRLVYEALEYIHANYHKDITLSQVAGHLYITPTYLSKLFSTEVQVSFSNYLLSYRIKIAKELLRNTHQKIYEISEQVGYTDTAHFSKLFKRATSQTPNQYRNRKW